jgi:adenylyl-sulfate kinase
MNYVPFIIFLHGLSGSGKSTIGRSLYDDLSKKIKMIYIDGDEFRSGISKDLGFSLDDRKENIRRLMEVCKLLLNNETSVIISFIAPTEEIRNIVRDNTNALLEVWCNKPLNICENDDVKGLYKKELKDFTGKTQLFEVPLKHQVELATHKTSVNDSVCIIKNYLSFLHSIKIY